MKVPLQTDKYQVEDVADLKKALKNEMPDIVTCSTPLLTAKAVKAPKDYKPEKFQALKSQAMELKNGRDSLAFVLLSLNVDNGSGFADENGENLSPKTFGCSSSCLVSNFRMFPYYHSIYWPLALTRSFIF